MPSKYWFCVGHNNPRHSSQWILFLKWFPQVSSRLSNWSFYFSVIGEYFSFQEHMVSSCFAGIRVCWCCSHLLLLLCCSVLFVNYFNVLHFTTLWSLSVFFSYFRYHFAFKPHLRNRLNCGLVCSQSHLVFDPFVLVSRTTGTSSAVSVALFLASHYITAIHNTVFFSKEVINLIFEPENPYRNRFAYFPLC